MKKSFLILSVLLIFLVNNSYSQYTRFETGIEAGGGSRRLYGNQAIRDSHDPVVNWEGGIFLQYNHSNKFSLRTAIDYELKGSVVHERVTEMDLFSIRIRTVEILTNLNYLSLPLFARLSFGRKAKFYINAGPYVAYLLSARKFYYYNSDDLTDDQYDVLSNFRRFDMGFSLEPGFSVAITKSFMFGTGFRYSLGLVDISKSSKLTLKTSSGLLLVGFGYRIK